MRDYQPRSQRILKPSTLLLLTTLLVAMLLPDGRAQAEPFPPSRQLTLTVDVTLHIWWLTEWETNDSICQFAVDHAGDPTRREVLEECGWEVFHDWLDTPSCEQQDPTDCTGLYLHYIGDQESEQTLVIDLQIPWVEVDIAGCELGTPNTHCDDLPDLVLRGYEPLPNHSITSVRGTLDGVPFHCEGSSCRVPFVPSHERGKRIVFWAVSSYGDMTQTYKGRIRAINAPDGGWYIDVLSSQFLGISPASCSQTWGSLPSPGRLPPWLTTPDTPEELASTELYEQLARQLVDRGVVDTEHCPNLGYLEDGSLNACAVEAARPVVSSWQNQFDQRILDVARSHNVPAVLLKRIFAQESQLWPGLYPQSEDEIGFGQLTDNGADATLLWNKDFFSEFCPLILSERACSQGYTGLLPGEQAIVRGALLRRVDASCADCPAGVDLSRADASVSVFAESLLASCEQVGRMIRNTAGDEPGSVASYETLWQITVANYHGGSGCVAEALQDTWNSLGLLRWPEVAQNMLDHCETVPAYVEQITTP
ncbi:MAG: hypothetical protein R3191_00075 [Anaerolineales bacterium]|nr:hypothetical protein [Anaerolineales bacterium]